ncbi:MAG: hypothetical protein C5B45_03770 [Chlamydiae bacterium]|nr:MAG: hypothetical protein C5B45_03770 [Chlamydiota bacterium]
MGIGNMIVESILGDWIYLIKFKTGREVRVAGRFFRGILRSIVIKYETFKPQTNPRNTAPYGSVKRYDGLGSGGPHYNDVLDMALLTN